MSRADLVEWVAGAVSALLVAAIVGFLAYEAVRGGGSLPDLEVTGAPVATENGRTLVRFAVVNEGDRAAATVTVSARVRDGNAPVGERTVTIDYVPSGSRVTGGFYLPDARGLEIDLLVEGYSDP